MEKIYSGKVKNRRKSCVDVPKLPDDDVTDASDAGDDVEDESLSHLDLHQISIDIDQFTDELSTVDEKEISPEIPDTVNTFVGIIESRINKRYNSIQPGSRFANLTEEDEFFIEAIKRLSKLKIVLGEFPNSSSFNMVSKVLQQAMVLMEEEFGALLQDWTTPTEPIPKSKSSSSKSDPLPTLTPETSYSNIEQDFPGYTEENITVMNKIVSLMIPAGYQYECCQVYSTMRKDGLNEQVKRFEFEKFNVEDVPKLKWVSLEPDITRWIKLANHCSSVLFPAERKLGETVFSDHLKVFTTLFINILRGVTTLLVESVTVVATAKPKAKRLLKFLEMYVAIRDLGDSIDDSDFSNVKLEESCSLTSEISSATYIIGQVVLNMFNDLKSSIKNDANKTPIQGGGVHPTTRYVMNYIKCAFDEYQHVLEYVFREHTKPEDDDTEEESSILSKQLLSVIQLLDSNLETKSALYKDASLGYIFLMNNDRFILQTVKEMNGVLGDNWCRRKSSDVRNYHKSYQRETWNRLLQCLTQEGVQVKGKPNRRILKERFKNFNAMFDEIYKTQSTWVVSDDQLLSEIRVSITAVVSPAYRSFVGRYKPQFEGAKSIDKYIKYQPEDVEAMIETLFEGTEKVDNQMNSIQAVSTVKQTTGAFKNLLKSYKNVGLM
ncbi:unnamed protein product [Lactuca saligna]|uniref:Exocyst subunit Exo70 family protein n=1 Tax=Lactuca saligna TaxID=75948 RepID=A0AA35UMF3_LACSI|nr:unnamed protein product [Lactuca saligna]